MDAPPQGNGAAAWFAARLEHLVDPPTLAKQLEEGAEGLVVLDVREEEFAKGHVSGAVHAPRERVVEVARRVGGEGARFVAYCCHEGCLESTRAAHALAEAGLEVLVLLGGWERWEEAELPTAEGPERNPAPHAAA
jgi:rhodanese-related sulfurtransferase